jgi:hypothetical protein
MPAFFIVKKGALFINWMAWIRYCLDWLFHWYTGESLPVLSGDDVQTV